MLNIPIIAGRPDESERDWEREKKKTKKTWHPPIHPPTAFPPTTDLFPLNQARWTPLPHPYSICLSLFLSVSVSWSKESSSLSAFSSIKRCQWVKIKTNIFWQLMCKLFGNQRQTPILWLLKIYLKKTVKIIPTFRFKVRLIDLYSAILHNLFIWIDSSIGVFKRKKLTRMYSLIILYMKNKKVIY